MLIWDYFMCLVSRDSFDRIWDSDLSVGQRRTVSLTQDVSVPPASAPAATKRAKLGQLDKEPVYG